MTRLSQVVREFAGQVLKQFKKCCEAFTVPCDGLCLCDSLLVHCWYRYCATAVGPVRCVIRMCVVHGRAPVR